MATKSCFCINPKCQQPDHINNNNPNINYCQSCGSQLLLNGQFRVGRLLSNNSGFGDVYEVFKGFSASILKVLKPEWNNQPKAIELFKREYEVLAQLTKQGITAIPEVLDLFEYQTRDGLNLYCLVMEKVEGIDLEKWVNIHGKINQNQALKWLKEILLILDKIHSLNYFHRDLKPANIMMRNNGELVLIDFGTAREETQTYLQKIQGQRSTGIVSVGYTPREQELGQAVMQSDFFALGRTFVHLLTGKHPIDLYDNFNDELVWQEETENINPLFLDLIEDLMKRLKDRPQNSQVILEKLTEIEQKLSQSSVTNKTQKQSLIIPQNVKPLAIPKFTFFKSLEGHSRWETKIKPKLFIFTEEEKVLVKCPVNSIAFSPDSNFLASGGNDNNIRLWNFVRGNIIRSFYGHSPHVLSVAFSPDGKILATGGAECKITIWDVNTGQLLSTFLRGHSNWIRSLNFSPDGKILASCSGDQTIKIWNINTCKLLSTFTGHSHWIRSINFSPDGQILASGSDDHTIKIWDINTGQEIKTLIGHSFAIFSVNFSPDAKFLASGSVDKTIKIWDVNTGQEFNNLIGHSGTIFSVSFSPDGKFLASASDDHTIKIWDVNTGKELHTITNHSNTVYCVKFSPDGKYLASASHDCTIKIWQVEY